jgi:hypothetical protein
MNAQTRNYYESLVDSCVFADLVSEYSNQQLVSCWLIEDDLVKKHRSSNEDVDYHAVAKLIAFAAINEQGVIATRKAFQEDIELEQQAMEVSDFCQQANTISGAIDILYNYVGYEYDRKSPLIQLARTILLERYNKI